MIHLHVVVGRCGGGMMIGATAHSHLYQAQYRGGSSVLTHNCASDQAGTLINYYRTLHPLKSLRHWP